MTIHTRQDAFTAAPAIGGMVCPAAEMQSQIDRELALISGLITDPSDQGSKAISDASRLASMAGLVGKWAARRAERRRPGAALN